MSASAPIDKRAWLLTGVFLACFLGLLATGVAMQRRNGDAPAPEISGPGRADSSCPATGVRSAVQPLSCSEIHAGLSLEAREPLPAAFQ